MDVLCPRCSAKVPASAVNLERMIAKCGACDAVFAFEAQVRRPQRGARIPRPGSITVEGESPPPRDEPGYRDAARASARGTLRITRRWFGASAIFTLFFSLIWNAFLVFWYGAAFSAPDTPWIMFVFPLGHVAVGVGLFYWSLATLLNRTTIVVDGRALTVRHGPVPWWGARDLEVDRVRQLFVRSRTRTNKGRRSTTYALCADDDGVAVDLATGLRSADEARYVEQLIEDHLAIVDDPSANEAA